MKAKLQLFLVFTAFTCSILTLTAVAQQANKFGNMALVRGYGAEYYWIHGVGGIKVTGGQDSRRLMTHSRNLSIEIDGSGIAAHKYLPVNVSADFSASPNASYFVSAASVCTLPSAVGCAGQEIVVCNTSKNDRITYQATSGETIYGIDQARTGLSGVAGVNSSAVVNSRQGEIDRFLSDGKNWYRG